MNQIEQLLRETIGLDAATVGTTLVERAVRSRMKALGLNDAAEYANILKDLPEELDALIESVVITETWFFRDEEPFKIFTRMVLGEWVPRNPGTQLRIASIPCSTGEEAYSMVMSLLDAGLTPQQFHFDAVDVSERALEIARLAVYGKNSFRGKSLEFRDRHFTVTHHGAVLNANVRDCVRFHRANILDANLESLYGSYHFIFCRNLLIYLDPVAQEKLFAHLRQLLAPNGVVFLGPAELPLAMTHGFVSTNVPMAFACRKASPVSKAKLTRTASLPVIMPGSDFYKEPPSIEKACRLADSGKLQEAAAMCQSLLHTHGASATAFYLLGLARDATGDITQAESCFRKALYLEPNHHEALSQMIELSKKKGDEAQLRAFQRRAKRVQSKKAISA